MDDKGFAELYSSLDKEVMKIAEDSLNPKLERIQEIVCFAREAKMQRIGIANCITFEKESEILEKILIDEGFEVTRVNCKYGDMPRHTILPGYKGRSCNPAGQAKVVNDASTDLNVVMGLCLGHDMVFSQNASALSTTLLVKDRLFAHNPMKGFKEYTHR